MHNNYENVNLELLKDFKDLFENKIFYVDLADALSKVKSLDVVDKDLLPLIEKINICGIDDNMNVGIFVDNKPTVLFLKENDEGAYKNFVNIVKITSNTVKEDEGCVIV